MLKQWYFQVMGAEIGPISSAELKEKVKRGQIQPETLVRVGTDGKWQPAAGVKGLLDPPAPRLSADCVFARALLARRLGELPRAEELYREALRLRIEAGGERQADVLAAQRR